MRAETLRSLALHALFLSVVLGLWEWGARVGWIDPSFMGNPLGILSFTLAGAHPEDLAQLLDRKGVFVRHGHHCTMPLHDKLGVSATVRASFGVYTNDEDIAQLVEAIHFAREKLRLS